MTTSKTNTYRVNSLKKKKSYGASERLAFTYIVLLMPYGASFWESLIKAQTHLLKKKKKKKNNNNNNNIKTQNRPTLQKEKENRERE